MFRVAVFSACVLLVVPQAVSACDYVSDRSVVFNDNTQPICDEDLDSASELNSDVLNWEEPEAKVDGPTKSYWDEWGIKSPDTPLLTQSLQKNHFGLGIWMPHDLEEEEKEMTTEEWLRNHGLMLSVGFGDKGDGAPRMRFDYRWHELYDADWMMQIEVPF
ncbi:hypothetical protein QTO01_14320 [Vibrio mytili]|uniref:Lipoprotein n=1 Tax=Vibrio mytili TaxID=50718 RepID=A0A0C3EDL3_9VIBR|nr:hypothetical protein [Vibrio mytili]KIN12538.1 hypothetical protein SU60_01845 [Vibrio mytili]